MDFNFVQKNFFCFNHFYQKSFCNPNLQRKILQDVVNNKEILNKNSQDLHSCGILLNKNQEYHLFRQYNYLKYRIKKIIKDKKIGQAKKIIEIEKRTIQAKQIREILFKCNARLVVRPTIYFSDRNSIDYDYLFSNGYEYLLKCIDYFDFRKKIKFSTYFINTLNNNFIKDCKKIQRNRVASLEDYNIFDREKSKYENYYYNLDFVKKILENENLVKKKNYNVRKKVLISYYGLLGENKKTQAEIANELGVSTSLVGLLIRESLSLLRNSNLVYDPIVE